MKNKENLHGILLSITCLLTGFISQSNGVDSSNSIPPDESIKRVAVIGISAIFVLVLLKLVQILSISNKK